MLTISLASPVGEHAQALAKEFERIRKQKGKVYYRHSQGSEKRYTFVTASKELITTLSMLSEDGNLHLGQLVEEQLNHVNSPSEMLLEAGGAHGDTAVVTIARRPQSVNDYMVIHLSPAYGNHGGGH